jgi:hypothetical protein
MRTPSWQWKLSSTKTIKLHPIYYNKQVLLEYKDYMKKTVQMSPGVQVLLNAEEAPVVLELHMQKYYQSFIAMLLLASCIGKYRCRGNYSDSAGLLLCLCTIFAGA